jgi:hypothetical protein
MKITVYSDPGHSWGKVSIKTVEKLGLIDKISGFSYIRGNYLYLEEDCDLPLVVKALRESGNTIQLVESYTDKSSKIRNYDSWYGCLPVKVVK